MTIKSEFKLGEVNDRYEWAQLVSEVWTFMEGFGTNKMEQSFLLLPISAEMQSVTLLSALVSDEEELWTAGKV